MTTTISQYTAVASGASASAGIGGTASAGDWLQVTFNADGGAASGYAVPSDDVSGSTGWELTAEYNDGTFYRQDWIKKAVGGETTVTVTWGGALSHGNIVGFWASNLTQPDLYLMGQGPTTNSFFSEISLPFGCVRTPNETYIGTVTMPGNVIIAELTNVCNTTGVGQNSTASCIQHYCNDESTNNAGQTPGYHFAFGSAGGWVTFYGFWTDPGQTFPVLSGANGTAGTNTQDVIVLGRAQAGSILTMVASNNNAGVVPTVTDNGLDGGAAWALESTDDPASGGSVSVFTKVCVGLESVVHLDWGIGINRAVVLCLWENPTFPDVYVIDEGETVAGFFTSANPPSGNGQPYVAMSGYGAVDPASTVGMLPAVSQPGGSHTSYVMAPNFGGHDLLAAYGNVSADEGVNTTADSLVVSSVNDGTYVVLFALQAGGPPGPTELEGDGTFGLGGTGELTVASTDVDLEGTGTFGLGGTGELTITGGTVELAGVGGFGLGGTGHLTAAQPFPPVPPLPAMTGQLNCGIYDVFIFTRGLGQIVGRIPFNQINWSRVLDDTSAAEVTVNGVSNVGTMRDCCALLGSILPWEHEVGLYRNGLRVWSGPVTKVSFPSETVIIDALDLSAWLAIRNLHENHNDVQVDLATIWTEYVQDAMSVENSAGLYATVQALTGVLADRLYTEDMHTVAADAISELARTGLDWSCVDRRMLGGPVAVQPPAYPDAQPIPTLIDASFNPAPTVDRDGSVMANCVYSNAMGSGPGGNAIFGEYGPEFPATVDHVAQPAAPDYAAIEAQFGRIERVYQETKILDQPSADQNAATRYDLLKRPVDVISSGQLLPTAGIDIRQLTPGSLQAIHLSRACVQIGDTYRLKQLSVTANSDGSESVEGAWEPIGSIAAHEDLA